MSLHPLTPHVPRPHLNPGQVVHVNTRSAWQPAVVDSITYTTIAVTLTGLTGGPATVKVAPWLVRPALGHRLELVEHLHPGDEVAAANGCLYIVAAAPWRRPDGWWLLHYDNGENTALPPGAVLRLPDHSGLPRPHRDR